ncbi:MAG: D-glycerate dehydrogenase, partial [Armatimonadetes bacterium]|nr:D-glycerate dehydrogenase [Armatimonadota bacterium]
LLRKHCQVKVYSKNQVITKQELIKGVKWCDALLCLLTDKIDKQVINANPNLRVISNYAVGIDNIDIKEATKRKIPVTNTPGVLTDAVAEHAMALMFAIVRRLPESDRFTKAGKFKGWEPMLMLGTELKGKTLGIVGMGRIGSSIAERTVKGMGMKVMYLATKRKPKFEKEYKAKYAKLETILKKADIITLHVPMLPSTKHLIGAKQLKMMKKTAYLINTSRGPVVDEKIDQGLIEGQLAGVFPCCLAGRSGWSRQQVRRRVGQHVLFDKGRRHPQDP